MDDYIRLEKDILDYYDKELRQRGLILEQNILTKEGYAQIDGIVKNKKGNPLAVIEVKRNLDEKNINSALSQLIEFSNSVNCRFMILTDKKTNILYYLDRKEYTSEYSVSNKNVKELIKSEKIENIISKLKIEINNKKISKKITEIENKIKKEDFNLKNINGLFKQKIDFVKLEDNKYSFSETIEDEIFKEIFKEIFNNQGKIEKICRYTTFDTLFCIIKNETFRMNGICGMNDKTEVNYVENYIYEENKEWNITKSTLDKKKINNTFITSCCNEEIKDNLTLWRLYANDAKGVCLIFEIDYKKMKNFLFGEVIYDVCKLDVLKKIIQIAKEIDPNSMFVYKNLSIYKHFFKHPDYKDEKEIRLVYLNDKNKKIKKDWFLAQPFNLLNPFIEFNLFNNDFPLILKEIILGPKCLEQEMNKIQLETLLKEKGFNDVEVRNSNIKHYR